MCVVLAGTKMDGLEATPPQTPVPSKSSADGYFMTAEECLRLFPQRLKESFRVMMPCHCPAHPPPPPQATRPPWV